MDIECNLMNDVSPFGIALELLNELISIIYQLRK